MSIRFLVHGRIEIEDRTNLEQNIRFLYELLPIYQVSHD